MREGFDTGVSNINLESYTTKNLQSAIQNPTVVSELLYNEVEEGYWIGPFSKSPYEKYRVSPLGLVEHKYNKKKRLIVDLSAPHDNEFNPSINDLISKDDYSLSYIKLDDAVRIISHLGKGSWLCKIDVKNAFKNLPVRQDQWHLFGIKWQNELFFASRLVFGSRSSPKFFDQLAIAVEWIVRQNYGITHTLHLLDDFLSIDSPLGEPQRTMALLSHIFNSLHIPLAVHKIKGPTQQLEYLGIIIDTVAMECRLPKDKLLRMSNLLAEFVGKRTCVKRHLLSLLGHLVFASRVIVPGRAFMSRLFEASKKVKCLHYRVTLSKACKADIRMWNYLLHHWNGISMFLDNEHTQASDLHLYTDASGTLGFGGYFQGKWFASAWDPALREDLESEPSIEFQELYPIVVAAILWGKEWERKRILFHCDNISVVYILNKGRSPCSSIMKLMRRLVIVETVNNFHFVARHVPGYKNQIADSLSRLNFQKFKQLAPDAAPYPCAIPSEVMFH